VSTGTAIDAQLMTSEEVTYGTPVTPERGVKFLDESLKLSVERIESSELRSGRRIMRSDDWETGKRTVAGDINMELSTKGHGRWFKHMFGTVVTSQPAAGPSPTVYLHTFTPGDLPVAQTIQVGRPDESGTVQPFTYHGCRVASWQLECAVSGLAKLKVGIVGEDEETDTALAVVSYATGARRLPFVSATLTVGGVAVKVKSATLSGTTPLASDRFSLGSALTEKPLENDIRAITGTLTGDFRGLTAYDRFRNGVEAELVLTFAGGIIEDALRYQTVVTANVRFDGETPNVSGQGIVQQNTPIKVVDNGTLSIKVEYQTTDATP